MSELADRGAGRSEPPHWPLDIRVKRGWARMTRETLWFWQQRYAPYFFLAPFVVLFCAFMLYPLGHSVYLSLHKTDGWRMKFAGLSNYRYIVRDPLFGLAVLNTLYFTVLSLLLQIPLSLGLALLLNS